MEGKGFNMQNQAELNAWFTTTLQYAYLGSGRDEVFEDEILGAVKNTLGNLGSTAFSIKTAVSAILLSADSILGGERITLDSALVPGDQMCRVMQWVLKTIAVVWVSKGRAFHNENIEAVADNKIIGGIQGGRSRASRGDLDLVVRKTVRWGLSELGINSVTA